MSIRRLRHALAALPLVLSGVIGGTAGPALADADTQGVYVTCNTATLYANYSPSNGPLDPLLTMYGPWGNERVGYRYSWNDSWDVVLHYRTNQWGFMLRSCHEAVTRYGRNDVNTYAGSTRRYVCPGNNVYVRDQQLRVVGRLFERQSMAIAWYEDSNIGLLAVGYAYGNVNKLGKMSANYFC